MGWAALLLMAALVVRAGAAPAGDTLTVIQRPLLNIPAIVTPGDILTIDCEADPATSGWAAELSRKGTVIPMEVLHSSYDTATLWWKIQVVVPAVPVYDLYDLSVTATGGLQDKTRNAVRVIPYFKNDYYFIHITDTHLVTHLYYYQRGADTDTSEIVDLREVIRDINIINPEFVLLTGDFVNEGELEDFLEKRYFTRGQRLLTEFEVPVYLTAGNHDLGGWDDTPPPDGTARQTWWKFFGWKRLNDPPPGAPWYTQNYSFDYGPVHYVGLEAYDNYDRWRFGIYGNDSFTPGQMEWLAGDLAAAAGSSARVLFYHYDFSRQINLSNLNADMALSGHIHRDRNDFSHPYDIITNNLCDGERSYRLVRVSNGVLEPSVTLSAGGAGNGLRVDYSPANDGSYYNVIATITNNLNERFEHAQLRFLMPASADGAEVTGGNLLQVDETGPHAVYYVGIDIMPYSSQTVTIKVDPQDTQAPVVVVTSPNGDEVWDIGSSHEITWTATDDIGVASVSIVLSRDGGSTYSDTLASAETNDGKYAWAVAADATQAARVKVTAYDGSGNSGGDTSDSDFEIRDSGGGVPSHLVITGTNPNPFGRHAMIRFGLPRDGWVEIDLYDVSGRLVRNLLSEEYPAGYHVLEWNNDSSTGPGLYFLRLRLDSDTTTQKVVVLR
jgi:hypothetical protein